MVAQNSVTTQSRGAVTQTQPTFAGVHEIASGDNFVYIRITDHY